MGVITSNKYISGLLKLHYSKYVRNPFLHTPGFESLGGKRQIQGTQNDNLDLCLVLKRGLNRRTTGHFCLVLKKGNYKALREDLTTGLEDGWFF